MPPKWFLQPKTGHELELKAGVPFVALPHVLTILNLDSSTIAILAISAHVKKSWPNPESFSYTAPKYIYMIDGCVLGS